MATSRGVREKGGTEAYSWAAILQHLSHDVGLVGVGRICVVWQEKETWGKIHGKGHVKSSPRRFAKGNQGMKATHLVHDLFAPALRFIDDWSFRSSDGYQFYSNQSDRASERAFALPPRLSHSLHIPTISWIANNPLTPRRNRRHRCRFPPPWPLQPRSSQPTAFPSCS